MDKMENLEWRKFNGEIIPNINEYVLNYVKNIDKNAKVMVGCDSSYNGSKYAITVVFYNERIRRGAHVVYASFHLPRNKDVFSKLWNEAVFVHKVAESLDDTLRKAHYFYKFERNYYDNSVPEKLVEIHVDLNANKSTRNGSKFSNNKSNKIYNEVMGWLCGERYKVMGKPYSYSSSTVADRLSK